MAEERVSDRWSSCADVLCNVLLHILWSPSGRGIKIAIRVTFPRERGDDSWRFRNENIGISRRNPCAYYDVTLHDAICNLLLGDVITSP
jgi:hypothetical protein